MASIVTANEYFENPEISLISDKNELIQKENKKNNESCN